MGNCAYAPVSCDDGDDCTYDNCVDGICVNTPLDCDDSDACTNDACVDGICMYTPVPCDDGDACTNDYCVDGICVNTPLDCDDSDACTVNGCVDGNCVYTALPCDDCDACTNDSCVDGNCLNDPIDCDDGDPCTTDGCAPADGCTHEPAECPSGEECVDGECVPLPVVMAHVPVGNLGNEGEWSGASHGGFGPDRICGAVDYEYNIGKYEVTTGQYAEFLNAVADTDTYELYNSSMWTHDKGCKIERSGSPGNYSYSVAVDRADRPVNFISWGDGVRFANWMHNGQPTGVQDLRTTEDGSYYLDGAMTLAELVEVFRAPDATWVIPNEDEWYKAAYHKNDGVTGNYFDYPTSSDSTPSNDIVVPDPGNNATFYSNGYTIFGPYWRTEVGNHENSDSPYGTFDQGGNIWEFTETAIAVSNRVVRGGEWNWTIERLHAAHRAPFGPTNETASIGFRVAQVP